jgi:phospholipase C
MINHTFFQRMGRYPDVTDATVVDDIFHQARGYYDHIHPHFYHAGNSKSVLPVEPDDELVNLFKSSGGQRKFCFISLGKTIDSMLINLTQGIKSAGRAD